MDKHDTQQPHGKNPLIAQASGQIDDEKASTYLKPSRPPPAKGTTKIIDKKNLTAPPAAFNCGNNEGFTV